MCLLTFIDTRVAAAPASIPTRSTYFDDMSNLSDNVGRQRVAQPSPAAPATAAPAPRRVPSMLFPGIEVMTSEYILPPVSASAGTSTAIASTLASLLGMGGNDILNGLSAAMAMPAGFNEPVIVRPTAAQIAAATTEEVVSENSEDGNVCAICQDDIASGTIMRTINHCEHSFHKSCIDVWFAQNVHCPVCRHDIRDIDDESDDDHEGRMENVD